jgi:caa(3)-type oxidase subunit IV
MSEHAMTADHADPGANRASHRRDYFRIFWVLLVLTLVEVGITYLHMDKRVMTTLMIGLALTKASFVGLYYMHLKYEKRSLLWLAALPLPLAGLYAVFLMLDAGKLLRAVTLPWLSGH